MRRRPSPIGWSVRMQSDRVRSGTIWRAVVGALAALLALTGCGARTTGAFARQTTLVQSRRPIMPGVGIGGRQEPTTEDTGGGDGTSEPGPQGSPAAAIPDVRGMVFEQAVETLWRSGIDFGLVFARPSPGRLWEVIEEDPAPGAATPPSAEVNLVLALPHTHGAGVSGTVRCAPERDELDDPYCLGKLLRY
jgi:hypothetical protein